MNNVDNAPLVSIIIPCMNEELTIGSCIRKTLLVLKREGIEGEIIVADSSTDNSTYIARSLGATVVIPSEKGYGNAYLESIRYAKGRYLILSDADDTYSMDEIPKFLKPLRENNADFVIGNRLQGNIIKGSMPWLHRYVGNPILTKTLNALFGTNIHDSHSGMRAITRDAYDKLNLHCEGMEFASEMIIEAARKRLRITEIPITYYPRKTPSKLHSWGDGWRHLRFMMLYDPTPFFYIPGILLLIFGIVMTVGLATRSDIEIIRIHSFILGGIVIIIGMQIIVTGGYMNIYGMIQNKIDRKGLTAKLLDYHSLEVGLIIGIILFISGIMLGLSVVFKWISSGFGSLSEIKGAIISMVLIAVGVQMALFALIVSVFILNKKENNR
jgi:glycosyltransferase involved in cell wall biosynthesis